MSMFDQHVSALIVYDCQSLLNIRKEMQLNQRFEHHSSPQPYCLLTNWLTCDAHLIHYGKGVWGEEGSMVFCLSFGLTLLLPLNMVLLSSPVCDGSGPLCLLMSKCGMASSVEWLPLMHQGVDHAILRNLTRDCLSTQRNTVLHLALLNVCSVANKTFMLKNFFVSKHLDFIFLTETWLRPDELRGLFWAPSPELWVLKLPSHLW